MLLLYENQKKTNQITECGNKAFPSKGHRRMDTTCMVRYLMQNHPKVIQILCIDNCTRWGRGWPNPLLQALRKSIRRNLWWCWSDSHWNFDWWGRRGRRRDIMMYYYDVLLWCIIMMYYYDVLLWCIIMMFWDIIKKVLQKVTIFNKRIELSPQG